MGLMMAEHTGPIISTLSFRWGHFHAPEPFVAGMQPGDQVRALVFLSLKKKWCLGGPHSSSIFPEKKTKQKKDLSVVVLP